MVLRRFLLAALVLGGCGKDDDSSPAAVEASTEAASPIPPRPPGAPTGTQFLAMTDAYTIPAREQAILDEISSGNLPDFLRTFVDVTAAFTDAAGAVHTITYSVMPDYLSIGTDGDFVRIPMNPRTGQKIADLFECSMITRKMVNDVWTQATVKLAPIPMTPGPEMLSNAYFGAHQQKIEAARAGKPLGALTAGQKKDVVISNALLAKPNSVAIYGWHQLNGVPIQPLSTVHEWTYADYSHGVRLVKRTAVVDGQPMLVTDVLKSPSLHKLLSDEGVMTSPRIPGVPVP
ncbi:MAG: hypothetical protein HYY17_04715 [Planctomycetes bacterium]|nr:hypothetical protein [Planctomycetota bacterium]